MLITAACPKNRMSTLGLHLKLLAINGIYPLTAFAAVSTGSSASRSRAISPTGVGAAPTTCGAGAPGDDADLSAGATQAGGTKAQSGDNGTARADSPEPPEVETRKVVNMMCDVKAREDGCDDLMLTIVLRMDDKMNRQLTSCIAPSDNPKLLAQELVHFGFINEDDRDKIASLIEETLQNQSSSGNTSPTHGFQLTAPITVATSQTTPLVNSVPPLTTVNNSTPTQVPMHSTS